MTREIKYQVFDPEMFRDAISTFHHVERERSLPWTPRGPAGYQIERNVHPIHEFRLATQTIQIAFDEKSSTLHIGEREKGRRGWVEVGAEAALMAGSGNPYLREVHSMEIERDTAENARAKHARVVLDAVSRLKSTKPGVRRRARRLLERLGR